MVTMNSTQLQMSQQEIEAYAKRFLKEAYNMELTIPIVINGRLSATLGRYGTKGSRGNEKPVRIEISKKYLTYGSLEDIKGTIRHELIHHALHLLGKPFDDGHPEFEAELIKQGSHSTETVDLKTYRNVRVYECNCREFVFLATISSSKCNKCNGTLLYKERRKQLI